MTTSCPSPLKARARIVPTCPDPPGITIFISLLPYIDEAASGFLTRNQALFEPAKDAIPVSSDNVVQAIRDGFGRTPHRDCAAFHGHPSSRGDEKRCVAPA